MLTRTFALITIASTMAVPLLQADPNDGVPFGVAASAQSFESYPSWIPKMSEIGVRWVRTAMVRVHSGPGKWDWPKVDAFMEKIRQNRMSVICILAHPTPWIKKESATFRADHEQAWKEYVTSLVTHLRGQVRHFQIWNEPQNFFFKNDAEAYARHVVIASEAARAIDPDCKIGIGVASVDVNYLARTIQAGARGRYDFITVHPYEAMGQIDKIGNGSFLGIVKSIRSMLAETDPERVNVPIWFTEIGAGVPKFMSPERQAQSLCKAYVMAIAQGVAGLNWYEAEEHDKGFGLIDPQGKPTPGYYSMKSLIAHLGEKPKYLGWVLFGEDTLGFCFAGKSGPVLAIWSAPDQSQEVSFDAATTVVDPLVEGTGIILEKAKPLRVTGAPVLILNVPAQCVQQAQANLERPFPWGGDYTNAKSVSFQFGNPNIESGLHKLGEGGVAVTIFGGPAGDMSNPNGASFVVDPNFISYMPAKVRVTVTARRAEESQEAGFSLKYESTNGFKQTPPVAIPGGDQWHVQTWELADAAFAGKWVYNFTLIPSSKSKYYIRDVAVTKP